MTSYKLASDNPNSNILILENNSNTLDDYKILDMIIFFSGEMLNKMMIINMRLLVQIMKLFG